MNLNKAPDPDLWISCLELARLLIDKDVDFCLDLKIGNQSFSLDTKKSRKHLDFSDPTGRRSKHKSASTLKRDKLRLERFLARKSGGRQGPVARWPARNGLQNPGKWRREDVETRRREYVQR